MKRFEVGETYHINGGGTITVTRRTEHFLEFFGSTKYSEIHGRKKIYKNNLFGLGEHIQMPEEKYPSILWFCFAGHPAEEGEK